MKMFSTDNMLATIGILQKRKVPSAVVSVLQLLSILYQNRGLPTNVGRVDFALFLLSSSAVKRLRVQEKSRPDEARLFIELKRCVADCTVCILVAITKQSEWK
jgi:hypothetical protein